MDLSLSIFFTEYSIRPAELGRAAEERGFTTLFLPEHTHIPAERLSPYPGGGELPREYSHTLDPFVALGAVAAVTERLKVGTGVCLVVERDPIVLAKEVATIDLVSDGRFVFGVGMGWNREEMANHGTDPRTRVALMSERMAAMQALWTQEEASHSGRFVNFDRVWSWPKPVQQPRPPVLVGGSGPSAIDRLIEYGDGWMPINRGDDDQLAKDLDELQRRVAEAGRQPVPVQLFAASSKPEKLERYRELGIAEAVLPLRSLGRDDVLSTLDRYAALVA